MIETEKATNWADLPHRFQKDAKNVCMCGRARAHELHRASLVERASTAPVLLTEKGS